MPADLCKGTRVRAKWLQTKPIGTFSLSGMQPKIACTLVELTGTCRHFRGDDPVAPTKVRIYVEPDGDVPEGVARTRPWGCECDGHDHLVEIRPEWVVEVIDG